MAQARPPASKAAFRPARAAASSSGVTSAPSASKRPGHLDHPLIQHVGQVDAAREQMRAVLGADAQGIAEALGGDQNEAVAGALQQGVGGHRGAHLDGLDLLGRDGVILGHAQQVANALKGGVGVLLRVFRQQLVGDQGAVRPARHHVGKGAAAINPDLPAVRNLGRLRDVGGGVGSGRHGRGPFRDKTRSTPARPSVPGRGCRRPDGFRPPTIPAAPARWRLRPWQHLWPC